MKDETSIEELSNLHRKIDSILRLNSDVDCNTWLDLFEGMPVDVQLVMALLILRVFFPAPLREQVVKHDRFMRWVSSHREVWDAKER